MQNARHSFMTEMAKDHTVLPQIIDNCPVAIFVIDAAHTVVHWNRACEQITGWAAEKLLGTTESWKAFYPQARPVMANLIVDRKITEVATLYPDKCAPSAILPGVWEATDFFPHFPDGGKWLAFTAAPLLDKDGKLIGAIETLRDITAETEANHGLEENRRLLATIINGCPVPMFVIDRDHRITHWNRACAELNSNAAEAMIGSNDQWKAFYAEQRPVLADLIVDQNIGAKTASAEQTNISIPEMYPGICRRSTLIEGAWEASGYFADMSGGAKHLFFTAAPLTDETGQTIGAVETLQDITAQKQYEQELARRANHDHLTGLANRNLLGSLLEKSIAHARRNDRLTALLFLDLDNFKQVNDTLGHGAGDQVLCILAGRLSAAVRDVDTIARIGGDEFVIVLHDPASESYITDVVHRLQNAIGKPMTVNGQQLYLGASTGIAIYPKDGADQSTLLMHGDIAMYRAKETRKGSFCYYTADMNERARLWLQLKHDLHNAETRGELELYFQPQYSLQQDRLSGAEALIRWNHPELGQLSPGMFIPIAEESGLIVPIGNWVIHEAVQAGCRWKEQLNCDIRLSVNLSARQFRYDQLCEMLQQAVELHGFHPFFLELELTESLIMEDPQRATTMLNNLKQHGFSLAMDDFGTGYSSLAYLRRFPFDMIKIDKSFIDEIGNDPETEAIVTTMLNLARALRMKVVAEGVELPRQLEVLRQNGCDEIQGFLYSRPLSESDFIEFLRNPPQLK